MIKNLTTNCLGTAAFDGKFSKMRKHQDFTVYPLAEASTTITVQSHNRIGTIDLETGVVTMSAPHGSHAGHAHLQMDIAMKRTTTDTLPPDQLQALKDKIASTGSTKPVGTRGMVCDNIGAIAIGGL